ncbi:MAG TPA: NADH-quinone oxidoreductase subunit L [Candidatus Paceibacterota bacterium]|nr:NADH-quinone oxidoreductase subunit L [Verrucomicrobiota bacterium]HRZ43930.1 NADH-quinone oxidoreductase subunit L [Candidatus Paceibacterota bacterium]
MQTLFPWLILLLPLAAAALISLFTRPHRDLSARLSIGAIVAGFWLTLLLFALPGAAAQAYETRIPWLAAGGLQIDFGLRIDRLSLLMALVVTAVGGAIHIYSYEYMRGERRFSTYFACLSLFTFAMLGVVFAPNFVQMFFFWELVGVSSYLLIGFWFERPAAADAGLKAFLVNRVGDLGFLLGILLVWSRLGSVHFGELERRLAENPAALGAMATVAGLLIFCGALGKSAQFPLHIWLPDAMEGPTPVSALIHAATMVAAGVYMLARVFFLLAATPHWPAALHFLEGLDALEIIRIIGLFTALMAGLIALQQDDIKRVLAYSTLSQLGYMVMAIGLGQPGPAMFHLATHAGFKALLFLGAGAIILALHHEQDIWRMGGLRRAMPLTFWTFLIATLALCAVPPLGGFYSKESILAHAWHQDKLVFALAWCGSVLTALYMFRLVLVVFGGSPRRPRDAQPHEPSHIATWPMLFLAGLTVLAGGADVEGFLAGGAQGTASLASRLAGPLAHAPFVMLAGLAATGLGFAMAWGLYRGAYRDPLPARWSTLASALRQRLLLDAWYARWIGGSFEALACLASGVDRWIIAGAAVRGVHGSVELTGRLLRLAQTGKVSTYAFALGCGVAALLYWLIR